MSHSQPAPTQPGWYVTKSDVNDWQIYALSETGQWSAHQLNGDSTPCDWSYIDQAGLVQLLAAYPRPDDRTCDRGGCTNRATHVGQGGFHWCDEHLWPNFKGSRIEQ